MKTLLSLLFFLGCNAAWAGQGAYLFDAYGNPIGSTGGALNTTASLTIPTSSPLPVMIMSPLPVPVTVTGPSPLPIAGNVTVIGPSPLPVGGSVSISNVPMVIVSPTPLTVNATIVGPSPLPISGNVTVVGPSPLPISGNVTVVGPSPLPVGGTVSTKAPVNISGSTILITTTASEGSTVAPSNTVCALIEAESGNTVNIRVGISGTSGAILSSTLGTLLEPGRNIDGCVPMGAGAFLHYISVSSGSEALDVVWVLSQ